jgi:DNA-directed RNA polymerase specialized sigma subunit
MSEKLTNYRVRELERKVAGLQNQVDILHALRDTDNKKRDRQIRDLEINAAVNRGLPKKEVAKIFKLSPGRVSQLTSRSA